MSCEILKAFSKKSSDNNLWVKYRYGTSVHRCRHTAQDGIWEGHETVLTKEMSKKFDNGQNLRQIKLETNWETISTITNLLVTSVLLVSNTQTAQSIYWLFSKTKKWSG